MEENVDDKKPLDTMASVGSPLPVDHRNQAFQENEGKADSSATNKSRSEPLEIASGARQQQDFNAKNKVEKNGNRFSGTIDKRFQVAHPPGVGNGATKTANRQFSEHSAASSSSSAGITQDSIGSSTGAKRKLIPPQQQQEEEWDDSPERTTGTKESIRRGSSGGSNTRSRSRSSSLSEASASKHDSYEIHAVDSNNVINTAQEIVPVTEDQGESITWSTT
jgi:hypothetical protein